MIKKNRKRKHNSGKIMSKKKKNTRIFAGPMVHEAWNCG